MNNDKKQSTEQRIPQYSRLHPVIPQHYVSEWKTDMKNRKLVVQNAELGQVPNYEHDESLYLYKREQMSYNVEDRDRVDNKYKLPNRSELLRPEFHHPSSRYQSSLMFRKDKE